MFNKKYYLCPEDLSILNFCGLMTWATDTAVFTKIERKLHVHIVIEYRNNNSVKYRGYQINKDIEEYLSLLNYTKYCYGILNENKKFLHGSNFVFIKNETNIRKLDGYKDFYTFIPYTEKDILEKGKAVFKKV